MPTRKLQYASFLVRIWRPTAGAAYPTRIALQDLASGEWLGFTNLDGLYAFLDAQGTANAGDDDAQKQTDGTTESG
jgi:hypothetical protein